MKAKLVFLLAILSFSLSSAMAQSSRISGSVSDNLGPIMMANVVERDANNRIVSAATTDMNGNFSMVVKNTANHLSVSYVGCKSWNKVIGAQHVFNIKLEGINNSLKEVTVTSHRVSSGGLNIPKREMSVSQQTMDMQKVEGIAFTSVDEALQGRISGLDIVANSGNLGSGTTMRLRGSSSVSSLTSSEPLIVVNGNERNVDLSSFDVSSATDEQLSHLLNINVEDIE